MKMYDDQNPNQSGYGCKAVEYLPSNRVLATNHTYGHPWVRTTQVYKPGSISEPEAGPWKPALGKPPFGVEGW